MPGRIGVSVGDSFSGTCDSQMCRKSGGWGVCASYLLGDKGIYFLGDDRCVSQMSWGVGRGVVLECMLQLLSYIGHTPYQHVFVTLGENLMFFLLRIILLIFPMLLVWQMPLT